MRARFHTSRIPGIGARSGVLAKLLAVVVISHDRSLPDHIATHILTFEGDSKVPFFDGNFSEYDQWRSQVLSHAGTGA